MYLPYLNRDAHSQKVSIRLVQVPKHNRRELHICRSFIDNYTCISLSDLQTSSKFQEKYPIERSKNAGANPRNMEVKRDKTPVAENRGRTIEQTAANQRVSIP